MAIQICKISNTANFVYLWKTRMKSQLQRTRKISHFGRQFKPSSEVWYTNILFFEKQLYNLDTVYFFQI